MKTNELKDTDLMIGDWVCVVSAEPNTYRRPFYQIITAEKMMMIRNRRMVVKPIRLTPVILENNGFKVKKIMPFEQKFEHRVGIDGRVELDNRSEYIHSNNTWAMYIKGDRGITSYVELSFLHELQHQLKHCKINKMITI